jgi:hypothetical protein
LEIKQGFDGQTRAQRQGDFAKIFVVCCISFAHRTSMQTMSMIWKKPVAYYYKKKSKVRTLVSWFSWKKKSIPIIMNINGQELFSCKKLVKYLLKNGMKNVTN